MRPSRPRRSVSRGSSTQGVSCMQCMADGSTVARRSGAAAEMPRARAAVVARTAAGPGRAASRMAIDRCIPRWVRYTSL
eukprot:6177810-Prymnesium_polylepis.2